MKKERLALSVREPWAWLIINGGKDVENRTWTPSEKFWGKRIFIHASRRRVTVSEFEDFLALCKTRRIRGYPKSRDDFDYGCVIGSVLLKHAKKNRKSYWAVRGLSHLNVIKPKK